MAEISTTKKRMTADEWEQVRARWESDPRDGYTWVVNELNLSVSDVAVLKRARKQGWAKKASLKTIVERAQTRADEKKVSSANQKVSGEVSRLTDSDAVDLRADVIEVHRNEWGEHRAAFPVADMTGEDGLAVARAAKTAAEAIKIRQEGERKAWGLDAISEDTSAGVSTLAELDAMFAQAMKRADEMKESVRKERGAVGAVD